MTISTDAIPYTSPSIVTVLVIASYLLFLSIFYHAFQKLFSAGILGPLVLGAIYARPLANILPDDVQSAILSIGYLGLILLIVQGGLEARMDILSSPKNLAISMLVGVTGIILPIGIGMALLPLGFGYSYLESFAVGSALASTSLGTTFAVLSSFNSKPSPTATTEVDNKDHVTEPGIANTRIGTILVGAALLDDIVGLVITSVVSTLGSSKGSSNSGSLSIKPWTIARPIISSFLLLVISWLLSQLILAPVARQFVVPTVARLSNAAKRYTRRPRESNEGAPTRSVKLLTSVYSNHGLQQLVAMTLLISTVLAYSVISEEIGSSLLIGAFCSGAMMKFLYAPWSDTNTQTRNLWSPNHLLSTNTVLGTVQEVILMPFFFSSIGSAIPVKSMFEGTTVWRGIIFAGLMAFAKVCAGGWILLVDPIEQALVDRRAKVLKHKQPQSRQIASSIEPQPTASRSFSEAQALPVISPSSVKAAKSLVWPVSLFLGLSLMSRGEIGFLILNIANQGGLLSQQAFNVAIWAITLNTLAGPMSIGILMRTHSGRSIVGRDTNSKLGRWS